jgi:hypothetical protein
MNEFEGLFKTSFLGYPPGNYGKEQIINREKNRTKLPLKEIK